MFICFKFNGTCIRLAMGGKQNENLVTVQFHNKKKTPYNIYMF